MKKNIDFKNNKKLNMIREFSDMLSFHLENEKKANDYQVMAAAEDAGFKCDFTKTDFTVKKGKENFTISFKNGMNAEKLQTRVTDLFMNTIVELCK